LLQEEKAKLEKARAELLKEKGELENKIVEVEGDILLTDAQVIAHGVAAMDPTTQGLAWMANRNAMTIGFNRAEANNCQDCNIACDNICPMRLKPRTLKRKMFTCTQCGECIEACIQAEAQKGRPSLLKWVDGECAHHKITGKSHVKNCF
ncbi:MAG TPA: hypothetical protein EYP34_04025, partial [Chromatiaceae bacterium]|nr:hypothetical protein [Chromatiaceae bacterium]